MLKRRDIEKGMCKILILGLFAEFGVLTDVFAGDTPLKFDFSGEALGCVDIHVYKSDAEDMAAISVKADRKKLGFGEIQKTFEIGNADNLKVEILVGKSAASYYCNDVLNWATRPVKKLHAKSGQVTISAFQEMQHGFNKVNVTLDNAHFYDELNNETTIVDHLDFKNVRVGGVSG